MSMRVLRTRAPLVLGLGLIFGPWCLPGCGSDSAGTGPSAPAATSPPVQGKAAEADSKGVVGPKSKRAALPE
jgi:hypothetical protein